MVSDDNEKTIASISESASTSAVKNAIELCPDCGNPMSEHPADNEYSPQRVSCDMKHDPHPWVIYVMAASCQTSWRKRMFKPRSGYCHDIEHYYELLK